MLRYLWCSPTRRSFLTGRYPVHITGEQAPTCSNLTPLQFSILSEKLAAADYQSTFLGKGAWCVDKVHTTSCIVRTCGRVCTSVCPSTNYYCLRDIPVRMPQRKVTNATLRCRAPWIPDNGPLACQSWVCAPHRLSRRRRIVRRAIKQTAMFVAACRPRSTHECRVVSSGLPVPFLGLFGQSWCKQESVGSPGRGLFHYFLPCSGGLPVGVIYSRPS